MAHAFLSDEWLAAVLALRDEFDQVDMPAEARIVMNQVISDVPFGDGKLEISVDTTSGALDIKKGHLDNADVMVRTDYATAKSVLVEQDPQAVMQAFMSGKILVEGDIAKLMTMHASAMSAEPHPQRNEPSRRLRNLTEF
ncbi:MAG: SCP2 sterol-binding domain-containing protein [Actinomycetota bacterium]|nr:SCP2 sterol-binding domain-containing protein [Actinomycetota bacterium]